MDQIKMMLQNIADNLARMEGKLDALFAMKERRETTSQMERGEARAILRGLTSKQHATAQMVVLGISEEDMARRMRISRNTVKLHMRALYRKLNVHTRHAASAKLALAMDAIDAAEYRALAYGLPKSWAAQWQEDDEFYHIIEAKKP